MEIAMFTIGILYVIIMNVLGNKKYILFNGIISQYKELKRE
jgi:hypothetical protein